MNDQPQTDGLGRKYEVDLGDGITLTLQNQFGLPRPEWDAFRSRTESLPEASQLYGRAVEVWLNELATALKPPYRAVSNEHVLLLSGQDDETTSQIMRHCAFIRQEIARILTGIVTLDLSYPDIVLIFNHGERYSSYVARYYKEGEAAGSGGMCVNSDGVQHIAMPWQRWDWQRTLAHEFSHVALSSLTLPLWLDEGLVSLIEQELSPRELHLQKLAPRELRETRQYWRSHDLAAFWSGEAFFDVEGQEHAYRLAEVLIRNLNEHYRKRFGEFVRAASPEGDGNAAAVATLGITLRQGAEIFLGPLDES